MAIVYLVAALVLAIWRSRQNPGCWNAEAIRQRQREGNRLKFFVPSVACVLLLIWLAFTRDPADGLSAVFFAIVAYLARPDWIRRKSPFNHTAP